MAETKHLRDGRAFDRFKSFSELPLLFAALALIPVLAVPFIFELGAGIEQALGFTAWFIWALFVVEYLVWSRWHRADGTCSERICSTC